MNDKTLKGLLMCGAVREVPQNTYLARKRLEKAEKDLHSYLADYRDQKEVIALLGADSTEDPYRFDVKNNPFGMIGTTSKDFRPNMDINHRVWRQYVIVRLCTDAFLAHEGYALSKGFLGMRALAGDRMLEKIDLIESVLDIHPNHLVRIRQMKRSWGATAGSYSQGFSRDSVCGYFAASIIFYNSVCKAVLGEAAIPDEFLDRLMKHS
ncbi:hypothetical protein J7K50_06440 [bacterium]|nr:hypothetical protein [bacterium]